MVNTSVKNVSSTSSIGNLVLSLSLLIGFCLFLQGTYLSQNYFITVAKDSMACKQVNFFDTNAQGKIIDLEYVTEQNDTVRLSKKDIPEIYKKDKVNNRIIFHMEYVKNSINMIDFLSKDNNIKVDWLCDNIITIILVIIGKISE